MVAYICPNESFIIKLFALRLISLFDNIIPLLLRFKSLLKFKFILLPAFITKLFSICSAARTILFVDYTMPLFKNKLPASILRFFAFIILLLIPTSLRSLEESWLLMIFLLLI